MFIVLGGCHSAVGLPDAEPFDPPVYYRTLWRSVESCSGLMGALDQVTWFRTPGPTSNLHDAIGSWYPLGNRIVLNEQYLDDFKVVRHEMLHAIEQRSGHSNRFRGSCAGVVSCEKDCLAGTGGPSSGPTSGSPQILPADIIVGATLISPTALDSGYSTLIISATNPYSHAVWVALEGEQGLEFDCRNGVQPCGTQSIFGPGARGPFAASETRREAFVFHAGSGPHTITASYNSNARPPIQLIVP